ncbi:unnamed protein product [Spirodela intermedia]|uniref:Uncharacterized protein n=2 Tax=Spirodela intermedia TaxID=51605 RepID=A0A7I8JSL7_SPIIN|nr:unnamed protein product [Spirodela intermedia]CAA6673190.1 unnamed protein product [Spirodela intermedia]CAA7410411.1 unnamed protein product [Spirodela intermedia]
MSAGGSYSPLCTDSGAMYSGVPLNWLLSAALPPAAGFDRPKSAILARPSPVTRRFCGLMSQWTRPAW